MEKLGINTVDIIVLISVFMGMIMTMQTVMNTENPMLPRYSTGLVLRDTLLLEFSSTIMSLLLAGKVGSNIASELGTMRITEQIVLHNPLKNRIRFLTFRLFLQEHTYPN